LGKHTALYAEHQAGGAKIVDFAGWDMPIHYGSQLKEHQIVREAAGMFDVSHMQVIDLAGAGAEGFLQRLLANDVAKLTSIGKALYSAMLNADGGVIDDLIVYKTGLDSYRIVVNAGTAEKDIAWMQQQIAGFDAILTIIDDVAMIAVQGPKARELSLAILPSELCEAAGKLAPFFACWNEAWFIGRTGYTGEDGFEVILPAAEAAKFWQALLAAGVAAIGLGARDTLRLEAGMNLYGSDMTETTSPLISGLGWTIAWEPAERDFIGRTSLEAEKEQGVSAKLVGLVLEGRGVLRDHQQVITAQGDGEITSGSFSPTMQKSIALARVPYGVEDSVEVDMRGKAMPARIVKPPFVRNGKVLV